MIVIFIIVWRSLLNGVGLKFTVYMRCCFAVCPVPMTKEEEEYIKQRERNIKLMEEIAREIEITCLGKLK